MIWYIIGGVVILGLILALALGRKKPKADEGESGQINGGETEPTTIEPTVEDATEETTPETEEDDLSESTEDESAKEE